MSEAKADLPRKLGPAQLAQLKFDKNRTTREQTPAEREAAARHQKALHAMFLRDGAKIRKNAESVKDPSSKQAALTTLDQALEVLRVSRKA